MYSSFADKNYIEFFTDTISDFGGVYRNNNKYVFRKYVSENKGNTFPEKGAYFGCINEGEDPSGVYSDTSVVIFPSNEDNADNDKWIISLIVGSCGYKNDYDVVTLPGTQRIFKRYLSTIDNSYIKNDFLDIESVDGIKSFFSRLEIPES